METSASWLDRAIRIVVVSAWVALSLGILGSVTAAQGSPTLLVAAATLSGVFATTLTVSPGRWILQPGLNLDFLVITGAILTGSSVTLTGNLESSYLLMALIPTLLASIVGGFRMGLTTAFLSAGLLSGVTVAVEGVEGVLADAGTVALFPLLALVVAQIRSLLVDIELRAAALERESVEVEARLQRMVRANDLLRRLTDLYSGGGTNPVEVSRSALEAIVDANPGSFATATLFDKEGPVVVARVGTDAPDLVKAQIPLGDEEATSGVVSLGTLTPLSQGEWRDVQRLLRPVAVAFSNASLLQAIAGEAVQQERLRLARELHDEVGPALAAIGLSIDAAIIQSGDGFDSTLQQVRGRIAEVVDDLRAIVADLRAESYGSFSSGLRSSLQALGPIDIDIEERRPPRSTAGRQILAIVTESVRNARRHADATSIQVQGSIDRDRIELAIKDNGRGFKPAQVPEGHYGIMGMRERADRIGARIEFESGRDGTIVHIDWKERP